MWKLLSSLLLSFTLFQCRYHSVHSLLVSCSQGLTCGDGKAVLTVGVNATVECTIASSLLVISPTLPKGLFFSNGTIYGVPVEGSPLTRYSIGRNNMFGYFFLGGLSFDIDTYEQ